MGRTPSPSPHDRPSSACSSIEDSIPSRLSPPLFPAQSLWTVFYNFQTLLPKYPRPLFPVPPEREAHASSPLLPCGKAACLPFLLIGNGGWGVYRLRPRRKRPAVFPPPRHASEPSLKIGGLGTPPRIGRRAPTPRPGPLAKAALPARSGGPWLPSLALSGPALSLSFRQFDGPFLSVILTKLLVIGLYQHFPVLPQLEADLTKILFC